MGTDKMRRYHEEEVRSLRKKLHDNPWLDLFGVLRSEHPRLVLDLDRFTESHIRLDSESFTQFLETVKEIHCHAEENRVHEAGHKTDLYALYKEKYEEKEDDVFYDLDKDSFNDLEKIIDEIELSPLKEFFFWLTVI